MRVILDTNIIVSALRGIPFLTAADFVTKMYAFGDSDNLKNSKTGRGRDVP